MSALRRVGWALLVAIALGGGSCENPAAGLPLSVVRDEGARGSTSGLAGQTEPVAYRVTGSGPGGASFSRVEAALPVDVRGLVAGEWRVCVEAIDEAGVVVLEGEATALVAPDGESAVSITLSPVQPGAGSFLLEMSWPPALVAAPGPVAVLQPDEGDAVELTCTVEPAEGSAVCVASAAAPGPYRLEARLLDGGEVVAGRAELVTVVAGGETGRQIDFDRLNKPGTRIPVTGPFTVAWDPAPSEPDDPIAYYQVHVHRRDTFAWVHLGDTEGPLPTFDVTAQMLEPGRYDFAVIAVTDSGLESDHHTSLDDTADPATGWYVDWDPGE